jgi:hypothetical protein
MIATFYDVETLQIIRSADEFMENFIVAVQKAQTNGEED